MDTWLNTSTVFSNVPVLCTSVQQTGLEGWTEDESSCLEQSSWPAACFRSSELSVPEYAANTQEPDDEQGDDWNMQVKAI